MLNRLPMLFTSVAIGIVFAGAALMMIGSEVKARTMAPVGGNGGTVSTVPSPKIQRLLAEIAYAKKPDSGKLRSALKKAKDMLWNNELRTGADYLVASMIFGRGTSPEDALLSHDLAICAMTMNESRAKEWAAYSQDQFLARIGHRQRYGTQVRNGKIVPTTDQVPDTIRYMLGLPALVEAKMKAFDPDSVVGGPVGLSPATSIQLETFPDK